jgi:hypothetical protein
MGDVYQAYDAEHDANVALKVLNSLTPEALLLFKNEFRALRDIQHPNVISLGELLEDGGRWFFTMEYVEGEDFTSYVRHAADQRTEEIATLRELPLHDEGVSAPAQPSTRARGYDEARLRGALGQLACGLSAIHAAGKVHRDVKPSNVRVTAEGRVVLLDFGLVADVESRGRPPQSARADFDSVLGTPAFMAPEQLGSRDAWPEADWYAVGVILFLALTGRLPFDGRPVDVLTNKQRLEPPPPSALVRDVPSDLDALCVELLRTRPGLRPSGREVLARLRVEPISGTFLRASLGAVPLVGREAQLAELDHAFAEATSGRAATVCVRGESGVGKTALVRTFTHRIEARGGLVLVARCYENELVPFKAVDGIVDALSRHLLALPPVERAARVPHHVGPLTQIFPVLRRVREIDEATRGAPSDACDPQELRSRAFSGARDLLERVARRGPTVLVIDDMHWSDADSLLLLREVMRAPGAPPLLLLLTTRSQAAEDLPGDARVVALDRLSRADARTLATSLLEHLAIPDPALATTIAEEGAGHPLFLETLARDAQTAGRRVDRILLEEALARRVDRLDPGSRTILEVLAVAGTPLATKTTASAVGIDFAEFSRRATLLRVEHLLRFSDADHADSVEPYHDRVRAAVLSRLSPPLRSARHRQVAVALETTGRMDPEALAAHWQGAGDAARASGYALTAAAQAMRALAFERAAHMYRLALDLGIDDLAARVHGRVALGDALKNAGRGHEAAQAYLGAAKEQDDAGPRKAPGDAADPFDLRRRAAEALLIAGHVDDGLAALSDVLRAVGFHVARSPAGALVSLLANRARLRVRGLHFDERDAARVPADELRRIDVTWTAALGLSMIDNVRSADFQCRNLLLALHAGEPRRIARALAVEAAHASIGGLRTEHRANELFAAAEAIARRTDDPYALGLQRITAATAAYLAGRWARARALAAEGEAILRARCIGVLGEINSAQLFGVSSLWFLGELRELVRRAPQCIAQAEERGDLYSEVNFRTGTNQAWLVAGDVDEARRQMDRAMASWSHRGVHMQHFFELYARAQLDLYVGDGPAAYARVRDRWRALERALLFRIEYVRVVCHDLRARAALAAARADASSRAALLATAERDARALAKLRLPCAPAMASMTTAALLAARGDLPAAAASLRKTAAAFDEVGMALHAASCRLHLASVGGEADDAALASSARTWFEGQRVADPHRFAAMIASGFAARA